MVRFYNNKIPIEGEVVVVRVDDTQDYRIKCSLLEYDNIEGLICKTETSRVSAKQFRGLDIGHVIPVTCSKIDVKSTGEVFIDLHYAALDKTLVEHYLNRYKNICKIYRSFAKIAAKSDVKYENMTFEECIRDQEILKMVEMMAEDSLHKLKKDDFEEIFYQNTFLLHEMAIKWEKCNEIPNFMPNLIKLYPKPQLHCLFKMHINSMSANGVKRITTYFSNMSSSLTEYDNEIELKINYMTAPNYTISLKSNNLSLDNYNCYVDIVNNVLYNTPGVIVEIVSHHIETANGYRIKNSSIDNSEHIDVKIDTIENEIINA